MEMPNLHVRDVPPEAVEVLRLAADQHGRSLNAELVEALVQHAEREAARETVAGRLEAVRRAWERRRPSGYPPGLEPETIIRQARDAR